MLFKQAQEAKLSRNNRYTLSFLFLFCPFRFVLSFTFLVLFCLFLSFFFNKRKERRKEKGQLDDFFLLLCLFFIFFRDGYLFLPLSVLFIWVPVLNKRFFLVLFFYFLGSKVRDVLVLQTIDLEVLILPIQVLQKFYFGTVSFFSSVSFCL